MSTRPSCSATAASCSRTGGCARTSSSIAAQRFSDLVWKSDDVDLLWRWERGLRLPGFIPGLALAGGSFQDHFWWLGRDVPDGRPSRAGTTSADGLSRRGGTAAMGVGCRARRRRRGGAVRQRPVRAEPLPYRTPLPAARRSGRARTRDHVGQRRHRPGSAMPSESTSHSASTIGGRRHATRSPPGGTLVTPPGTAVEGMLLAPGQSTPWPLAHAADGRELDLRQIPTADAGTSDVFAIVDLPEATATLRPADVTGAPEMRLSWSREHMPALLLWLALGGDTGRAVVRNGPPARCRTDVPVALGR